MAHPGLTEEEFQAQQDAQAALYPDITDAAGNIWTSTGGSRPPDFMSERLTVGTGEDSYQMDNPYFGQTLEQWQQQQMAEIQQNHPDYAGFFQPGPGGALYAPQVVMNAVAAEGRPNRGFVYNWIDSGGPVKLLGTLITAGALGGFDQVGAAASTGAAGETANALGLQQMAAAAGLPAGSTASEAFIASGGTMGSTAAGGLGSAGTLAESFGYATPEAAPFAPTGGSWWDVLKDIPSLPSGFSDSGPDFTPLAAGAAAAFIPPEPSAEASPALGDAPAAPKPGAPDYQQLWQSYAGWIDNVNRTNEGAFADVRARLSAAGAAPDLIKMQTEHLESQRLSAVDEFNKSSTFGLLQEGYDISVGGKASPYEGGLAPYAGAGKPELMDFYTELYGQPSRAAGGKGTVGTGGTPSTSGQSAANPWFEDAGQTSLIG